MRYNSALELHPHLSKLLDSLCFELAVNIPDENSLSLLEILDMRKVSDINEEEFKQLYRDWLASKNVFNLLTAKQVRVYSKSEFLANGSMAKYLEPDSILDSLQLLNSLHNELYLEGRGADQGLLSQVERLFDNLDANGNIHLGLSPLFFLTAAMLLHDGNPLPASFDQFRPILRARSRQFCEVDGIVSLRWFKNYFLQKADLHYPGALLSILQDIQRGLRRGDPVRGESLRLPDLLSDSLNRWRGSNSGLSDLKRKRLEIFQRIFMENEELFFYSNQETTLFNTFVKKYGESYLRSVELDSPFLKELSAAAAETLEEWLAAARAVRAPKVLQTPTHPAYASQTLFEPPAHIRSAHRHNNSALYQTAGKGAPSSSLKEKTPVKKQKGFETRRFNVTPTQKMSKMSPLLPKQFGSTSKSRSKSRSNMTPTKSYNGYTSLYPQATQVFRNSKKEGLDKDSFYEKLFFFRNKRVESYDIVMKRLRGR